MKDEKPSLTDDEIFDPRLAESTRNEITKSMLQDILKERRQFRFWKNVRRTFFFSLGALSLAIYVISYLGGMGYVLMPKTTTVAVVNLEGAVATGESISGDAVIPVLRKLYESPKVVGIVLRINSGGGSPNEADRIGRFIDLMRKSYPDKPVLAVCDGICASAAYMISLHTDAIYASQYSMAGSIGAIMKGWDASRILERFLVAERVFQSGPYKSLMDPFLPMDSESEAKAKELVETSASHFIQLVKSQRSNKLKIPEGKNIYTGEVWVADDALALGLIDGVQTVDELIEARWKGVQTKEFVPHVQHNSMFDSLFASFGQAVGAGIAKQLTGQTSPILN